MRLSFQYCAAYNIWQGQQAAVEIKRTDQPSKNSILIIEYLCLPGGNEWSEFLSKAAYESLYFKNNINQAFLFVICVRWKLTSQALLIRHEWQKEERKQSSSLPTSFSLCILSRFIMYRLPALPTASFLLSLINLGFDSIHMLLINIPAPQPSNYNLLQILTNSSSQQHLY